MTLVDEPLVQLVAEIPHRRQPDFLEGVFRKEGGKGPQNHDDQHRRQQAAELDLLTGRVPPAVKLTADLIDVIDDPAAPPFRHIALEDGVDDYFLRLLLARDSRWLRRGRSRRLPRSSLDRRARTGR